MDITVQQRLEILEDAGFEPRSYSGRGMFGARCCAIVVNDLFEAGRCLGCTMQQYGVDDWPKASTDSMARDYVVYWPTLKWPADREDPED